MNGMSFEWVKPVLIILLGIGVVLLLRELLISWIIKRVNEKAFDAFIKSEEILVSAKYLPILLKAERCGIRNYYASENRPDDFIVYFNEEIEEECRKELKECEKTTPGNSIGIALQYIPKRNSVYGNAFQRKFGLLKTKSGEQISFVEETLKTNFKSVETETYKNLIADIDIWIKDYENASSMIKEALHERYVNLQEERSNARMKIFYANGIK